MPDLPSDDQLTYHPRIRKATVIQGLSQLPGLPIGTQLDFHRRLTFLVGDNQTGKTTVLKSLAKALVLKMKKNHFTWAQVLSAQNKGWKTFI